jgi:N-acetylmuramoyl-L-alanine amidase
MRNIDFAAFGSVIAACAIVVTGAGELNARTQRIAGHAVDSAKCDRATFRVILDVGHTLEAHGAISARNVPEYDFNLRLAHEISDSLIADGFSKTVLLMTHGAARSSLLERVTVANHLMANLFLSIHHDSVPDAFLQPWEYDGKPSFFSDRFRGHALFVSYENNNIKSSLLFARLLGRQLKDRDFDYAHHYTESFMGQHRRELLDAEVGVYRYDQLVVLREADMPAVLLEAGSIINRDEELLMNSAGHRALISAAVTRAVEMFCEGPSSPS